MQQGAGQVSRFRVRSSCFRVLDLFQGVTAVKSEIDEVTLARGHLYRAPETLRKRDEGILSPDQTRTVEANE